MEKILKNKIIYNFIFAISVIAIVSFVAVAVHFVRAWAEPGSAPPEGNIDTLINIGSTAQYKSGALEIGALFETEGNAYIATSSAVKNVGIGTTTPQEKLVLDGGNFFVYNGNIDSPSASINSISASAVDITDNMEIGNNLNTGNGADIGPGGVKSDGALQGSVLETLNYLIAHPTDSPPTCDLNMRGAMYYDASRQFPCYCDGSGPWQKFDNHDSCEI